MLRDGVTLTHACYFRCSIELSSDHDTSRSSVPPLMTYMSVIKVMYLRIPVSLGVTEQCHNLTVLGVM